VSISDQLFKFLYLHQKVYFSPNHDCFVFAGYCWLVTHVCILLYQDVNILAVGVDYFVSCSVCISLLPPLSYKCLWYLLWKHVDFVFGRLFCYYMHACLSLWVGIIFLSPMQLPV